MSMDPNQIQQTLIQSLGQQQPTNARTSPMAAGAQIAQKIMLMKALQDRQAQQQGVATPGQTWATNHAMPAAQAQMVNDPTMQGMQQSPASVLTPEQLQALQQPVQFATPDPTGGAGG